MSRGKVTALRPVGIPYPAAQMDDAALALSNARALVNILQRATEGVDLPETAAGSLWGSLYLLEQEIERARSVLFSP
jgi:hypothetical protein